MIFLVLIALLFACVFLLVKICKSQKMERQLLKSLGLKNWNIFSSFDRTITVKSRSTLENYDDIKFFKEYQEDLVRAEKFIETKKDLTYKVTQFYQNI